MEMQPGVVVFFAFFMILGCLDAIPHECQCDSQLQKLPETLRSEIFDSYPGYRLVECDDLIPIHEEMWSGGPGGCPGLALIDIDGGGTVDVGFNLINVNETSPGGVFAVALDRNGNWEIIELLTPDQVVPVVIWAEEDASLIYESYERTERIQFPNGAIIVVRYESWSRAYGIVDGRFRFIPLTE